MAGMNFSSPLDMDRRFFLGGGCGGLGAHYNDPSTVEYEKHRLRPIGTHYRDRRVERQSHWPEALFRRFKFRPFTRDDIRHQRCQVVYNF